MADRIMSRAEAQAQGLRKYFPGTSCKRGHFAEKYVTGGCVECRREWQIAQRTKDRAAKGSVISNAAHNRIVSRDEAITLGLRHYFTGIPCKYGHVSPRYLRGGCIACRTLSGEKLDRSSQAEIGVDVFGRPRTGRYFVEAPCVNGHVAERLVAGGRCIECLAEESRVRYAETVRNEEASTGEELISRKQAICRGLKWYFTGEPCKYGHVARRYVSSHNCFACIPTRTRRYRLDLEVDPNGRQRSLAAAKAQAQEEGRVSYIGKTCLVCKFNVRRVSDGKCMTCGKRKMQEWFQRNKEYAKAQLRKWKTKNRDKYNAQMREYKKKWNKENPEKVRAYQAITRARYREEIKERRRLYCLKRRDLINERNRRWHKANPEKSKALARRKYANADREAIRERHRLWHKNNPEKSRALSTRRRAAKLAAPGSHTGAETQAILIAQNHRCIYCHADLRKVKRHLDHVIPLSRGGSNDKSNLQWLCQSCNVKKSNKDPIDFAQEQGRLL